MMQQMKYILTQTYEIVIDKFGEVKKVLSVSTLVISHTMVDII